MRRSRVEFRRERGDRGTGLRAGYSRSGREADITAASEGKRDVAHIIVTSAERAHARQCAARSAGAGVGTIYGAAFDPDPGLNALTLNGVPLVVTAATGVTVTFAVPSATASVRGHGPCSPDPDIRRAWLTLSPFAAAPQLLSRRSIPDSPGQRRSSASS
jgi:hypothetical protein